jgi:hypothetical protein
MTAARLRTSQAECAGSETGWSCGRTLIDRISENHNPEHANIAWKYIKHYSRDQKTGAIQYNPHFNKAASIDDLLAGDRTQPRATGPLVVIVTFPADSWGLFNAVAATEQ